MNIKRQIKCTFNWQILAGKTLDISVGTDIDSHEKTKTVCVMGKDKTTGNMYILHQEVTRVDDGSA